MNTNPFINKVEDQYKLLLVRCSPPPPWKNLATPLHNGIYQARDAVHFWVSNSPYPQKYSMNSVTATPPKLKFFRNKIYTCQFPKSSNFFTCPIQTNKVAWKCFLHFLQISLSCLILMLKWGNSGWLFDVKAGSPEVVVFFLRSQSCHKKTSLSEMWKEFQIAEGLQNMQ